MPVAPLSQAELYYEMVGTAGEAVVLVHGSWADHAAWQPIVRGLADSFRVISYDRRGHGQSIQHAGGGLRVDDERDLAELIEALDLAPAHIVANSFGTSIALGLATARPGLVASVNGHEPPLMSVIAHDEEMAPLIARFHQQITAVVHRLDSGDIPGGARQFIDDVAFGAGTWDLLPAEVQDTILANALTYPEETRDPHAEDINLDALARVTCPILLTQGDQSLPWFARINTAIHETVPNSRMHTFAGAGHAPHGTHPVQYVQIAHNFIRSTDSAG